MIFISACRKHAKTCVIKGTKKTQKSRFLCWHGFRIERNKFIKGQIILVAEEKKEENWN